MTAFLKLIDSFQRIKPNDSLSNTVAALCNRPLFLYFNSFNIPEYE